MFILSVAPLRAIPRPADQALNYFASRKALRGQAVAVPLGKTTVAGVVLACRRVQDMRIAVKQSPYPLRAARGTLSDGSLFGDMQLQFALWLSEYYYASLGLILQRMMPPGFSVRAKKPFASLPCTEQARRMGRPALGSILATGQKNTLYYRKFFRHASLQRHLMLLPDRVRAGAWMNKFPRLASQALVKEFYADLPVRTKRALWQECQCLPKEKTIVAGTRSALYLPVQFFDTISIEDIHDTSHTSWDQNPHVNSVRASLWFGEACGVPILWSAEIPGIETSFLAQSRKWTIAEDTPSAVKTEIADMREELKQGNRSLLSMPLQKILARMEREGGRIFLFIHRRGFASGLLCRDCGYIYVCPSCSVPMVYHASARSPILLCHRCGAREAPPSSCRECSGTRIKYIGGGTQRLQEELMRLFPKLAVRRLDGDTAKEEGGAAYITKEFREGACNVIIGTQFALKFFPDSGAFDYSAVVMSDGILSIPDFRAQERVYEIIHVVRRMARTSCVVQTYRPQLPLFAQAAQDSWDAFARDELALRKALGWPPFVQIIKLSYAHKDSIRAEQEAKALKNKLELQTKHFEHDSRFQIPDSQFQILGPAPAFISKVRNAYMWYLILKWPVDEKGNPRNLVLRNRFLDLAGKGWNVDVDPIDLV